MTQELNLTLQVWRQEGASDPGHFETYAANGISEDMSFLEMLDIINETSSKMTKFQSNSITTVEKVFAGPAV